MSTDKATRLATIANHCQLPGQIFMSQWGPPRTPGPLLKTQAIITPSLWSHTHFLSVGWTKHRPLSRPSVPQSCSICQKFCARVRRERWRQNHCRAERGKKKKKKREKNQQLFITPVPQSCSAQLKFQRKKKKKEGQVWFHDQKQHLQSLGKSLLICPFWCVCVRAREGIFSRWIKAYCVRPPPPCLQSTNNQHGTLRTGVMGWYWGLSSFQFPNAGILFSSFLIFPSLFEEFVKQVNAICLTPSTDRRERKWERESICVCGCNTKESRIQRGTKEPRGGRIGG